MGSVTYRRCSRIFTLFLAMLFFVVLLMLLATWGIPKSRWYRLPMFVWPVKVPEVSAQRIDVDVVCPVEGSSQLFLVNGTSGGAVSPFYIQGVGYSPTPPGMEPTDFYTLAHKYLYVEDIPVIAQTGANVIRVWEWDFTTDHTDFLDLLWDHGIRIFVPFSLTRKLYPDLRDEKVVRSLLMDFNAFASKYADHPAVLGYLVGNEVNIEYEGELKTLFPIVNKLASIVHSIDTADGRKRVCDHILTVPLANIDLANVLKDYYSLMDIGVWSFQLYSDLDTVFESYAEAMNATDTYKPLVLTEFGADAYNFSTSDRGGLGGEEWQAKEVMAMWEMIWEHRGFVGGGCVMEFVDEWWKGNAPDLKNVNCPDYKIDTQSSCGTVTGTDTYIHEEYLGMFYQDADSIPAGEYCIEARPLIVDLSEKWGGNVTTSQGMRVCRYYVSLADRPWVYYWMILLILFLGTTAMCSQCYSWAKPPRVQPVVIGAELNDRAKGTVENSIRAAFRKYDLPENTHSLEERLLRLVNDHVYMLAAPGSRNRQEQAAANIHSSVTEVSYDFSDSPASSEESSINSYQSGALPQPTGRVPSPVEVTYVRYFEAYYIWLGKGSITELPESLLEDQEAMIDELALWMLVTQASGTIQHCPEFVCAVYHQFQEDEQWRRMATSGAGVTVMLRPLFAYYYAAIQTMKFSFDDINVNGVLRSPSGKGFLHKVMHAKPLVGLCGLFSESAPEGVPLPDGEEHPYAREFIEKRPLGTCHTYRRGWIGSICSLLFNYSWLIRLDFWLLITAWYFQPNVETTVDKFVSAVSFTDSLWKVMCVFTQLCLVFPRCELQHFFFLLLRLALFGAVSLDILFDIIPIGISTTWYLIVSVLLLAFNWAMLTFRFNVVDGMIRQGRLHIASSSRLSWALRHKVKAVKKVVLLLSRSAFSLFVIAIAWALFFLFLVPSFSDVRYSTLCDCPLGSLIRSPEQDYICSLPAKSACTVAIILLWFSALLVSIVVLFSAFSALLILAGIIIGKKNYVANLVAWTELHDVFSSLDDQMRFNFGDTWDKIWRAFVDHLDEDWLISEEERTRLLLKQFDTPLENSEATRRVISCVSQLVGLVNSGLVSLGRGKGSKKHLSSALIRTMPSWTVVIPCYAEDVLYTREQVSDRKSDTNITMLEYLVAMYQSEWDNFCRRELQPRDDPINDRKMRNYGEKVLSAFISGDDMLEGYDSSNGDWVWKVRVWASCHGQTLSRTMRGLHNHKRALLMMAELAGGGTGEATRAAKQLVDEKYQMIIAHQLYGDKVAWLRSRKETNKLAFENFKDDMAKLQDVFEFDLAYLIGNDSFLQRHHHPDTPQLIPYDEDEVDMLHPPPSGAKPERRILKITRPGRLPIGEGKPENQLHAMQFATGSVMQTMDMNQYCTLENGFIAPFLLCRYFRVFHNNPPYAPKHRVLGFPEHAYTRRLSAVGEFMGMAEFAFVTILQRVLAYPLAMRLHYGHPDFWDAYWIFTRGGPSKATKKVNTNEDIFAGYELLARGESIGYTELLQAQKGRESSFNASTTFQAKLAQGAAQQIVSRDIYALNQSLPSQHLLSLFFGSLGFYVNNVLMTASITCYLYSIVLFSLAEVTFNQLGLLGAVIAVPWIIQIGFIQMFPVLVELCIQNGVRRGLLHFLVNLPLSLVFFLFHIGTNSYSFSKGLIRGGGGYMSTGRGFGLTRCSTKELMMQYAHSHYYEALSLLFGMIAYILVADEDISTILVRLWSISLVVISWFLAPTLFNPFPHAKTFTPDLAHTMKWLNTDFPATYNTDRLYESYWKHTKTEEDEYKELKKMWEWQRPALYEHSTLQQSSWQFWFWHQRSEQPFRKNYYFVRFCIYMLQWVVFTVPIYVLFLVTFLKLWNVQSIQLLVMILGVTAVVVWVLNVDATVFRTGGLHYGFTVATLLFFILVWVQFTMDITWAELFDSLMLQVLVLYLLDDIVRQCVFLALAWSVKSRVTSYMSFARHERTKHEQRRKQEGHARRTMADGGGGNRAIRIQVGEHVRRRESGRLPSESTALLSNNVTSALAYYGPRSVAQDLNSEGGVRPLQGTRGHLFGVRHFLSFYWYRLLRTTATLPKLFPYVTLLIIAILNLITIWANSTLTMALFNGRVFARWQKPAGRSATKLVPVPVPSSSVVGGWVVPGSVEGHAPSTSLSVDEEASMVIDRRPMDEDETWIEGEEHLLDSCIAEISPDLKRWPIPAGPDCLFMALAKAIGAQDHWLVRAQISKTLSILAEFQWPDTIPGLSEYLPQDKMALLDLVDRIMVSTSYGDESCVAAAAYSLNRRIVVLTVAEAIEYCSSPDPDNEGPTIYLAHNGRRHFDVVMRTYEM